MIRLVGAAPLTPATAYLRENPREARHQGWASAREPHTPRESLRRELAAAGLAAERCPDCGATMTPEACRALVVGGGPGGLGHALDVEFCCSPCGRFVAVAALFAGLALACGFAAARALAAREGRPAPPLDRWPDEVDEGLLREYEARGPGWSGGGTRRTWTLAGPVVVTVTMGTWESQGGRTYGEDLCATVAWPDGSTSTLDAAHRPLRPRHHGPGWEERAPDAVSGAMDSVFSGEGRV